MWYAMLCYELGVSVAVDLHIVRKQCKTFSFSKEVEHGVRPPQVEHEEGGGVLGGLSRKGKTLQTYTCKPTPFTSLIYYTPSVSQQKLQRCSLCPCCFFGLLCCTRHMVIARHCCLCVGCFRGVNIQGATTCSVPKGRDSSA